MADQANAGLIQVGAATQGYLALPAGGTGPGVVVIQEWWGMNAHVQDVTDRLARNPTSPRS